MLRAVRTANVWLHYVAGALIVGVMLLTVYNILGRWLFGEPFRGTIELTELAMLGIVYLGLGYAQHRDSHISVDLLYRRFRRPTRKAIDLFAAVLSVGILGLMAWQLAAYAEVLSSGGRETAARGLPLAPFAYAAVVGVLAYALASVGTASERLRSGRQDGSPDPTRWPSP
ncbi:MAG: TRAP transporter small permease [Jiangellaceae bacterium]